MRWRFGGSSIWRVAHSLKTLLTFIDSVWPERQPTDGTVGDLSHQARRSDHNPNSAGVVTAGDVGITSITEGNRLVSALIESRDERIKYIIFNKRIWRSYPKTGLPAWTPTEYRGSNPHKTHVHISVSSEARLYDDPSAWSITLDGQPATEEEQMLKRGDSGNSVELYQNALLAFDPDCLPKFGADRDFGEETETAVKAYQVSADLDPTGIIDGVTAANLVRYTIGTEDAS